MRIKKELIDEKLSQAPEAVREIVASEDAARALIEISQKFNIHLDQIGIVEEEALYAMLGIQSGAEFIKNVSRRANMPEKIATGIAQEINEKIIPIIREGMQNQPARTEAVPNKDTILAEIENPTPATHPISAAATAQTAPATPVTPAPSTQDVAHDFIGGKLAEPVSLPTKKTAIDPYREPIE